MTLRRILFGVFMLLVLGGSVRDMRDVGSVRSPGVLVADLHVHPFPGDGVLTAWQLQREATRRGVDVIAVAGHNNRVALALAHALGLFSNAPITLESQELTTPGFHIVAVGVRTMIDWRLDVPAAARAIHAQGGVAIAAHPVPFVWKPLDETSLLALDGVEVAHPMAQRAGSSRRELDEFYARARATKPGIAPIGSTDFHRTAPLGLCRTYLLTSDRSPAGAIDAIRQGRTVAEDQFGRLYGSAEHVVQVRQYLDSQPPPRGAWPLDRFLALGALLALAAAISSRGRVPSVANFSHEHQT